MSSHQTRVCLDFCDASGRPVLCANMFDRSTNAEFQLRSLPERLSFGTNSLEAEVASPCAKPFYRF